MEAKLTPDQLADEILDKLKDDPHQAAFTLFHLELANLFHLVRSGAPGERLMDYVTAIYHHTRYTQGYLILQALTRDLREGRDASRIVDHAIRKCLAAEQQQHDRLCNLREALNLDFPSTGDTPR